MSNRRKVVRKLKRQIRRKNAGKSNNSSAQNKTNNTSNTSDKQQNQQTTNNTEALMRLLAYMGGGRGGNVGSVDPSAFLNQREAAAVWQNEIARKKRDENAKKRAAEDEMKRQKREEEYEIAKHGAQQAEADAKHAVRMADVKLKQSGVTGVIEELKQRVRNAQEQIALNEQKGSLSGEMRKITEMQNTLKKIEDEVGYKIKTTPELMRIYTGVTDKLQSFINKFNEVHEGLIQIGELRDSDRVTQDLINDRAEVEAGMNDLIRHVQFETKAFNDAAEANEARLNEMTEKKYQIRNMQQELATARARYEDSQYTHDFDENGDLIRVYDESEKLPVIRPEDDEHVRLLKKERDKILKHIQQADPSMNLEEWSMKLKLIRQHTQQGVDAPRWITAQINKYNKVLSDKKRIQSPTSKKIYHNDIVAFASRFCQIENDYIRAAQDAKKAYEDAIAHNEKVEQSWHPKKVKVTDEMIEKINKEHADVREQIDEKNKQTERNKENVKRLKELARETDEMRKQLANKPDPEEEAKILDALRHAESEKQRLERDMTARQIRTQEHDKMRQDTERINVQNELTSKQLAEYDASADVRNREEKAAIEARVMAQKQRELNEKRLQTYKSEQDKRMAEHELNILTSENAKAMDDQIIREHVKSEEARIEKEKIESLRRAKKQFHEQQLAAEAMKMVDMTTKGVHGFDNITAQIGALGNRLIANADEKMRDDAYVKQQTEAIVNKMYGDPMLMMRVVKEHERTGKQMFKSPDELRAMLDTREKVDKYSHWVNGLSLTRPGTPPPLKPGRMYRFYDTPRDSSTIDMNFDDTSDDE